MPAVQLSRLKSQIDSLAWKFTRPEEFLHSLHELLDSYADRTYRPSPGTQHALIANPTYHVPAVVIKQLEQALNRWAAENGTSAILLASVLWHDQAFEPRLLGAYLLGATPVEFADEVLKRIVEWADPSENKVFLNALFNYGTMTLRRYKPQEWLATVQEWLSGPNISYQRIGLLAALSLIDDRSYQNLPAIFKAVGPVLQTHPAELQNELSRVIIALGKRSPVEIIYFIRQMLGLDARADVIRLIRRCIPEFPNEVQTRLLEILHSLPKNN